MATDYDAIRNANIREYGEGVRHLRFLGRLYTDRTHFLFELLQNAEDAEAYSIQFDLYPDRLLVRHTGRPFTEADVRGICGVDEGTKSDDLTKIGKFGIGFKAVYAYTRSPQIHSGDEHFGIEHYVRPYAVLPQHVERQWTTLFVFPFDHPEVPADQAFREIASRLETLSPRTLLFLRNIYALAWNIDGGAKSSYLRNPVPGSMPRRVRVSKSVGLKEIAEEWLVFDQDIHPDGAGTPVTVEAAFRVERDERRNKDAITPIADSQLVVFFPTEKETHLGFLIQGPYRTTPARDNVPQNDPWNRLLVAETAELVVGALPRLRDQSLLDVGLLSALPIRASDFPPGGMFHPLFQRVREALRDEPLLPAARGGTVAAREARLARGAGLVRLLSPGQLRLLCKAESDLQWLSEDITENRSQSQDLYQYLIGQRAFWLGRPSDERVLAEDYEIRPETVIRNLTERFVTQQDDAWVVNLYAFLAGQSNLWKSRELLDKPFIRLQDGTHVCPFRVDGSLNAYLPSAAETSFPVVKRELATDESARRFLVGLGLREPDIVADVLENVLPKYINPAQNHSVVAAEVHEIDIRAVFAAMDAASYEQKNLLMQRLRGTPFVRSVNATGEKTAFKRPVDIYMRTPDLEMYYLGNANAWFLAEGATYTEDAFRYWHDLALENKPRRISMSKSPARNELIQIIRTLMNHCGGYTSGLEVTDYQLDGLDQFLNGFLGTKPSRSQGDALALWNLLLDHLQSARPGDREHFGHGIYRWFYRTERSTYFEWAAWVMRLREVAWLPSRVGTLHKPGDLCVSDVPDEFSKDELLVATLGIKPAHSNRVEVFAQEQGLDPEVLEVAVRLAREHPEELVALQQRKYMTSEYASHEGDDDEQAEEPGGIAPHLDYKEELDKVFARPQLNDDESPPVSALPVSNPERRRARVREDIEQAQQEEPRPEQRFARVPRKVWDAKNNAVRTFLREQYGGHCQVCNSTFLKRDGEPYFEGLYLVSRTHYRWLERPGNVLCLCPTCAAKFLYGSVEADNITVQIESLRGAKEGGQGQPVLRVQVCGDEAVIRFTEQHLIDLQELVRVAAQVHQ